MSQNPTEVFNGRATPGDRAERPHGLLREATRRTHREPVRRAGAGQAVWRSGRETARREEAARRARETAAPVRVFTVRVLRVRRELRVRVRVGLYVSSRDERQFAFR